MVNNKKWMGILAMVLIFGFTIIGCDNGTNDSIRDSRFILDTGYAWVGSYQGVNNWGVIFNADGTFLNILLENGTWGILDTGTWTTSGNNIIIMTYQKFPQDTLPYTFAGTTLTLVFPGSVNFVLTKTAVTIP